MIPWRRKWQPTPVFLPGDVHGQRSLVYWPQNGTWREKSPIHSSFCCCCFRVFFLGEGGRCLSLYWPQGMWDLSSLTRDRTCASCSGSSVLTSWLPGKSHPLTLVCPWWPWQLWPHQDQAPLTRRIPGGKAHSLAWKADNNPTNILEWGLTKTSFLSFFFFEREGEKTALQAQHVIFPLQLCLLWGWGGDWCGCLLSYRRASVCAYF